MRTLVTLLPALACVGMVLVICLAMMRGRFNADARDDKVTREEVAALRDEVARLREAAEQRHCTAQKATAQ